MPARPLLAPPRGLIDRRPARNPRPAKAAGATDGPAAWPERGNDKKGTRTMNETAEKHAQYVKACGLAVDAAEAGAAAKAAWLKTRAMEAKAADLYAAAMRAMQATDDKQTAERLGKASRKHWQAQYVAEAGFQKVYESREIRCLVAAAPELLEALRRLLDHRSSGSRSDYGATAAAEAAIAKAEGRAR